MVPEEMGTRVEGWAWRRQPTKKGRGEKKVKCKRKPSCCCSLARPTETRQAETKQKEGAIEVFWRI